ncbi:MAG: AAA family ATPase [Ureaplasma sp.]|nr:AAA family ATPase [Ureaplasma sp.]
MIQITRIEFSNYRQYKNVLVDFNGNGENNLYVLKAQNGTGKTTFLNGILWCLYENEYYSSIGNKLLPLVNDSLIEKTPKGESVMVSVKLSIADDDKYITFLRTKEFKITENPLTNVKNVIEGKKRFVVTLTNTDGTNTQSYENDEETKNIVTQYFAEPIYEFYFFDGENLKNYFDLSLSKSRKIEESIFNIAQVNLLKTAIKHADDISASKYRESEKGRSNSSSLYKELHEKKELVDRYTKENIELTDKGPAIEERIKEIDQILREYAPIAEKQKTRDDYEERLKKWKIDYAEFVIERSSFIRKYLTLLNMYPRIKNTYEMIQNKKKSGKLPPNVNRNQLKEILENHISLCPVCNKSIDQDAISWISELLKKVDVSPKASNFLVEVNVVLEHFLDDCREYSLLRDKLIKKEVFLKDEYKKIDNELNSISLFLSKFGNHADEKEERQRIAQLEKERKDKRSESSTIDQRKKLNENEILVLNKRIVELESTIRYNESKMEQSNMLKKQVTVLRKIQTEFSRIKDEITTEIRKEIQDVTWQVFDSMIWKTNTFGKIEIDDNYKISVYNNSGREMTGSISATEKMALAYSFTLAIHEASGKNCPLVVDSPLGRVSDINRENMAKELLRVSKGKQIIMLFTPDEYSEDVKKIYDSSARSVREISLSSDEKEIIKVGV